jgi:hypothetical protein
MHKIVLASSLVVSLMMIGCKDRSGAVSEPNIAVKSASLNSNTNTIVTKEDYTSLMLFGESGSKVWINDKEVGVFPESGSLEVTLQIKEVGRYRYKVQMQSTYASQSQTIMIEVIKQDRDASLGSVQTEGEASALTVSKEGVIFVAEQSHGVEVISIGFNDRVTSTLLSTIESIDAVNVVLSSDESKLYVEDKAGKFHLLDISDLSHPVELDVIDKIEKSVSVLSEDASKRYRISVCGLIGEDVRNPAETSQEFILKDKEIQDVVLVDNDTKLLVAHGEDGLQLLDLKEPKNPIMIATKNLSGDTSGLSLLKKDGILFVANGEKGVEIFDLDILLHEMTR